MPIEILSKPSRAADRAGDDDAASARSRSPVGAGDAKRGPADGPPAAPGAKRPRGGGGPAPLFARLGSLTDPDPTPERQADLAVALLGGLAPDVRALVAEKLAASLGDKARARARRGRGGGLGEGNGSPTSTTSSSTVDFFVDEDSGANIFDALTPK